MITEPRPLVVPPKPTSRLRTSLVVLAFAAFTVATCLPAIGGIELDFGALIRNWDNGSALLVQFLQPDFSFLPRTFGPMLETLQMAVVGAAVAAVVSVPLTLWAAAPTNPNSPTRIAVRTVINVIRSVPDLVYATVLVAMVGVGALPGLLTLLLFDIGIIVKLVSEAIDSTDLPVIEAGRATGWAVRRRSTAASCCRRPGRSSRTSGCTRSSSTCASPRSSASSARAASADSSTSGGRSTRTTTSR